MTSETEIQSEILEYLSKAIPEYIGFFYRTGRRTGAAKWTSPARDNGVPDITGCYKGLWIGLEVKNKDGKLQPAQKIFQDRVTKPRGLYFVVRSIEDVINALKEADSHT